MIRNAILASTAKRCYAFVPKSAISICIGKMISVFLDYDALQAFHCFFSAHIFGIGSSRDETRSPISKRCECDAHQLAQISRLLACGSVEKLASMNVIVLFCGARVSVFVFSRNHVCLEAHGSCSCDVSPLRASHLPSVLHLSAPLPRGCGSEHVGLAL